MEENPNIDIGLQVIYKIIDIAESNSCVEFYSTSSKYFWCNCVFAQFDGLSFGAAVVPILIRGHCCDPVNSCIKAYLHKYR